MSTLYVFKLKEKLGGHWIIRQ